MWFECFDFISFCSDFEIWEQEKALRVLRWNYKVFSSLSLLLELEAAGLAKRRKPRSTAQLSAMAHEL